MKNRVLKRILWQNILPNYHILFARLLLKALATAWAIFMSLIIFCGDSLQLNNLSILLRKSLYRG